MTGAPTHPFPEDPRLLPLLPLVYVAWADGVLTADEIRRVRERLADEPWIEDEASRAFAETWLDPDDPPDPETLQSLERFLRSRADRHPRRAEGLAELGRSLDTGGVPPGIGEALEELEASLGVVGPEAVRALLAPDPETGGETAGGGAEGAPVDGRRADGALAPLPGWDRTFDPLELQALLDGAEADLRARVKSLLGTPPFERISGLSTPEYRDRVMEWIRILAGEGLGAVGYPVEHGGTGDFRKAFAVFDTLALFDLSLLVKFGVQFGLFGGSVLQLGTRRHHEDLLGRIGRAELPGCFAMTETGHGSNVRDIRTTATFDPATDEIVVHTPDIRARKDYIGNAALHGRLATVFAQLRVGEDRHGVHAVLVPIRDGSGTPLPGVTLEDCGEKEGLNGVDNGRILFDRVRVPRENLLDRFGRIDAEGTYSSPIPGAARRFFTMLGTLVAGRISIAGASVTVARTGLTIAVRYGDRRRQFGPAGEREIRVLDYRSHQRRLMPLLATTYALHFAVDEMVAGYGLNGEEERRALESLAAGLKAYASDHAVETLQACRELCGGQGYLAENRLGRLMADVDVFTTFEGANPVLLQLVARGLLTGFREDFEEMRMWGAARYLADRAVTAVQERNPLAARRSGEEHIRDREFHASAFRYREDRLLRSAALRLRGRIQEGMDSFDAANEVQDHLISLARAHVERRIHDAFVGAVEAGGDGELRPVLERLLDLFALSRIEDDRGWFLESGYMEGRKAKAVRQQVNELCREVRDDARGLVDAFGIPDRILGAPIALP